MTTPEAAARQRIDQLLELAGWHVQDRAAMALGAGLGVAVREYQLPAGPCDYLLFVDGKACGVVEAKPEGQTLIGVAEQSEKYMQRLPDHLASFGPVLLFDYESTGTETLFRDMRDPHPRSRHLFAFHKPETLLAWATEKPSLRGRLAELPPLDSSGLRQCQIEAISGTARLPGLERSLARGDPRILIQMATGAGKTFTACTFLYRLIKHAKVRRVLFLVDRTNLGDQALREFQDYTPPDDNRRFNQLYVTQHLRSNRLDPDAKVVITTIQRLFSMLKGEELPPEAEEHSAFEDGFDAPPRPVAYNPSIPIETFDVIVTDECHRSIYGQWRQVLDYFDATVIGLTATPSLHTLGFFGRNLVAEYPYERSVIDGVNVAFEVFRIKTEIGEEGGLIEAGFEVPLQDKKTRARRYQELDSDLAYQAAQLDRSVTSENQIRTVLEAYRTSLETELFPDREEVPKTLIFAKDDNHAENITRIAREVFGRGNDFVKKITYQTSEDPKTLLKLFRIARLPRIVVTVDMIATGTDVKPIEVLIFMRDVKSELYFEQMKGRGVRAIPTDTLLDVTPDAKAGKERFVIVDAVGVTESRKTTMQPLERQRHTGFKQLMEHVASGDRRDDTLTTLASRLTRLDQKLEPEDRARIRNLTGGPDLHEIATSLMQATEAEALGEEAHDPTSPAVIAKESAVKDAAAKPIADNPALRQLLTDLKTRAEIVIDEISPDAVISTGFDLKRAGETTERFTDFLARHKDELTALQILYSRPAGAARLTYDALDELRRALLQPPWVLDTVTVWEAYRRLDETRVRGRPLKDVLTELIALVRFATGPADGVLESYALQVERRFNLWLGRQQKAGRTFTDEQQRWLHLIKSFVAQNAEIRPQDLMEVSSFTSEGGLAKANTVFGRDQLRPILDELTEVLVA